MISSLIKQLLLFWILSLTKVFGNAATEYPFSYRTGKLNQFVGFATPRSPPPTNGPFIYGSIWASWSAWSFCVNKVRVRVRACNTVRGFSCLGKKQEFMECDLDYLQPAVHESDYVAVDPWEEDRREAMKQLYSQKYSSEKANSEGSKMKSVPPRPEIRRRERTRVTTKAVHSDQPKVHHGISNEGQITSTLHTRNSHTAESSSPFAEITTLAPLLTDKLEPNHQQQQQVSASTNQVPIPSVKQSFIASESSLLQPVHQASQVSVLPQTSIPLQSPGKPKQVEQSMLFTATERILIDRTEDQVVSLKGQELITSAPAKVLVWMAPGITTWVSQETSNSNIKFPDISTTIPITDMLNPIASETFVPSTESSTTTLLSSSSTTAITTNAMKIPKVEVKIPSDYQPSIPIPVAKALIPTNTLEAPIKNNEFLDSNLQFALPESNMMQTGLKSLKIHSNPMDVIAGNYSRGISLKKSDQISREDWQTISSIDILPEANSNLRYVPRQRSQLLSSSKTYVVDQSRKKLRDGEVDFRKARSNDRAAADKALDLLLKSMSSDDDIEQSKTKLLSNKSSYFTQSSNSEIELKQMREKVGSLKKTMKAMEEAIDANSKVEAYRKAMNLNLVPRGPSTSTSFPTTSPTVIDQSKIFLVEMNENASSSWSEWTNWQRCFCGKQIRTRVCYYETSFFVKGCKGKSYESRPCDERDHCPTTTTPLPTTISPISTSVESRFKKSSLYQPLSTAIAQKSDNMIRYFIAYNTSNDIDQVINDDSKLRRYHF